MLVGLDLSLTGTGVASLAPGGAPRVGVLTTKYRGTWRLAKLRELVVDVCRNADAVAVEGYAYAAKASHAHSLGELGGVVRLALWDRDIPVLDVPPSTVKLYACGKGNASKNDVLLAAAKRLDYQGSSNDEADAMWLLAVLAAHRGAPIVDVPANHLRALVALNPKEAA
jgi:crossover junction endodeoxyribonuclease RuvC